MEKHIPGKTNGVLPPTEASRMFTQARSIGDFEGARVAWHTQILPNKSFSNQEVDELGRIAGVVDVGDRHVAGRTNL